MGARSPSFHRPNFAFCMAPEYVDALSACARKHPSRGFGL
jgi:hypothetical protein